MESKMSRKKPRLMLFPPGEEWSKCLVSAFFELPVCFSFFPSFSPIFHGLLLDLKPAVARMCPPVWHCEELPVVTLWFQILIFWGASLLLSFRFGKGMNKNKKK